MMRYTRPPQTDVDEGRNPSDTPAYVMADLLSTSLASGTDAADSVGGIDLGGIFEFIGSLISGG